MEYKVGSSVMTNSVNIYTIFYGNWTLYQQQIVTDFISGLSSSSWYSPMSKYYYQLNNETSRDYVSSEIKLINFINDSYSMGHTLEPMFYSDIIKSHINKGGLNVDRNGIYCILTSSDVVSNFYINSKVETFGENYCGFHRYDNLPILFAQVPTIDSNCMSKINRDKSPNGDIFIDTMISVLAHEIVETVLSPLDQTSWAEFPFNEPGDKCVSDFGNYSRTSPHYNVEIGSRKFLIQSLYDLETNSCKNGNLTFSRPSVESNMSNGSANKNNLVVFMMIGMFFLQFVL